jgi:DNA helicase II / ATP-dependent DNA helicase PcrA
VSEPLLPDYQSQYQTAYHRLNPEQKQAVDTVEGPVMVLAGPGTGKTQMLSVRIAHILTATQAAPHNILALTFTQAGAKTMQQRLVRLIGPVGYGVKCSTFHGFCTEIIQENPGLFPISPQSQEGLSEIDKLAIMEKIILAGDYTEIKTVKNPRGQISDVYHLISNYKREGHTPDSLRQLLHQAAESLSAETLTAVQHRQQSKIIDRNREVIEVYAQYQHELTELQQYDFDDMILWVRDALRDNADLLADYQEKYQYVMVDEFQDTNQAQLEVVRLLMSYDVDSPNLCVVGDPNQSIYRFQGASLANTLSFLDMYPQATLVTLRVGYRCGQALYDAAAQLLASQSTIYNRPELQAALTQPLQAVAKNLEPPLVRNQSATTLGECFWLAQQLQQRHANGVAYADMAVLYRKHSHGTLLLDVLQRMGVPVAVEEVYSVLDHPRIVQIMQLLQCLTALAHGEENRWLLPVLQLPWLNLETTDVLKLSRAIFRSKAAGAWEYLQKFDHLRSLELTKVAALTDFVHQLESWQGQSLTTPVPQLIETMLRESGFYAFIMSQPGAWSDMSAVMAFLRSARSWSQGHPGATLAEWLERLQRMQEHGVKMPAADLALQTEAVFLGSAHQAKGREWSHVFLLHANDGKWGNLRSPSGLAPLPGTIPYAELDKQERNADERRLFYVAMTRAKTSLTVSYSQSEIVDDRRKELIPAQFMAELNHCPWQDEPALAATEVQNFVSKYVAHAPSATWLEQVDQAWLHAILDNFAMSASALNSYLTCPLQFFFQYVLKMPQATHPALAIGSAVHAAMEYLYGQLNTTGTIPALNAAWPIMERTVNKIQPDKTLAAPWAASAKTIIDHYFDATHELWQPSLLVERWFGTTTPIVVEGLRLIGKIDRIDLIDDVAKTVRVVDYKTGRVRSRNDILGQTASSDGGYWRQLLFYKLLADSATDFHWTVQEGELIFLEPNDSGKFKSERFTILPEQVNELKTTLQKVQSELQSLEFLHHPGCGQCDICRATGQQSSALTAAAQVEQLNLFLTENQ